MYPQTLTADPVVVAAFKNLRRVVEDAQRPSEVDQELQSTWHNLAEVYGGFVEHRPHLDTGYSEILIWDARTLSSCDTVELSRWVYRRRSVEDSWGYAWIFDTNTEAESWARRRRSLLRAIDRTIDYLEAWMLEPGELEGDGQLDAAGCGSKPGSGAKKRRHSKDWYNDQLMKRTERMSDAKLATLKVEDIMGLIGCSQGTASGLPYYREKILPLTGRAKGGGDIRIETRLGSGDVAVVDHRVESAVLDRMIEEERRTRLDDGPYQSDDGDHLDYFSYGGGVEEEADDYIRRRN